MTIPLKLPSAISTPPFSEREIKCVADMVFGEAGGEPFEGKVAVAAVALRRSLEAQWPDDLCDVVREPNQFYGYSKRGNEDYLHESIASVRYAIVHLGEIPRATFFHRKEMGEKNEEQYVIGNHLFYSNRGSSRLLSGTHNYSERGSASASARQRALQ